MLGKAELREIKRQHSGSITGKRRVQLFFLFGEDEKENGDIRDGMKAWGWTAGVISDV